MNTTLELLNISQNKDEEYFKEFGLLKKKFNLSVSLDKFINESPGVRLNLIMINANLYSSTSLALEKLFNLVIRGGGICFRGYGCKPWEGESQAVDEFIESNKFLLRSLCFSNFPSAYIIKS